MSNPQESQRVPGPTGKSKRGRRSALLRVFLALVGIFVLAAVVLGLAGFYGFTQFMAPGPLTADKTITVEPGRSTQEIAATMEQSGAISSATIFSAAAYLSLKNGQTLKPGEYEIPAKASMKQVLALILSGKSLTYKLTIPEGWTAQMAVDRINTNDVLTGPATTAPAEGSIRPDTYVFHRGKTRAEALADMQAAQTKLVNQLWEERSPDTPVKTKEEAVTLASIIEKETGMAEERPMVASVFLNRLQQGMRLQSDPTIIYGLTGGKAKLDRPLTREDIAGETPYNTYRIAGLPPGPISNPGREALEAVLNPPTTKYLYFVANGTGGHAFAETLLQHNANVTKWRAIQTGQATVMTTEAQAPDVATGMPVMPGADGSSTPKKLPSPSEAGQDVAGEIPPPASSGDAGLAPSSQAAPAGDVAAAISSSDSESGGATSPNANNQTSPSKSDEPAVESPAAKPAPATGEAAAAPAGKASAAAPNKQTVMIKPRSKPVAPTPAAVGEAVAAVVNLVPGTIVKVDDRLVPIPKARPHD